MEVENTKNSINREDERRVTDLRDIKITRLDQNGAISSIYYECGEKNKIICSIFGPMTLHVKSRNTQDCEVKVYINFLDKGKEKKQNEDTEVKKVQSDLKITLQNLIVVKEYPKSSIEINYEVIQNDGFLYANLINAASYALYLSGLLIFDSFSACAVAQMNDQTTIIDPTLKEVEAAQNVICVVYMTHSKKLPYMFSKGRITNEQLEKSLSLCIGGCNHVSKHYESLLAEAH